MKRHEIRRADLDSRPNCPNGPNGPNGPNCPNCPPGAPRRAALKVLALALCSLCLLAAPKVGGQPDPGQAQIQRGSLLYQIHCLQCHGEKANGRGPMAKELRILPSNLRTIAARYDGFFPRRTVFEIIDGARFVRGHGEQQMPVWGITFLQRDTDTDQTAEVEARIHALIAFLESIQE